MKKEFEQFVESLLKEEINKYLDPKNENYGYLGTIKISNKAKAINAVLPLIQLVAKKANIKLEPVSKNRVFSDFLDSTSGRHIADQMNDFLEEDKPFNFEYIYKNIRLDIYFKDFIKTYDPEDF